MRENGKKQQLEWFEDQLVSKAELAKQADQTLKDQIHNFEDIHAREAQFWADMKLQYEVKIDHLKMALEELWSKTEMGVERIHTLFHSQRNRFVRQLKEALDRGWASWTKQAAELHTFRADHDNRAKEGKGFFKLNNDSIATVREDLAKDYQALADQQLEEVTQILEAYGAAEEELGHQIQATEADRLSIGQQTVETIAIPNSPPKDVELLA